MQRLIEPEILDRLPADDPEAIRSRRDLRGINFLMGNERWLAERIARLSSARKGVWEIGAGEGKLLQRLASRHPEIPLTGCDLAPRPVDLPERIVWRQGDVFDQLPAASGGVLVANLFLHHFDAPLLARFGSLLANFDALCLNEPHRSSLAMWQGRLLLPFVGPVTRHDMLVSIRAGFRLGELPEHLGLTAGDWRVREETTWRGALRVLAWRD
jgi:hypothetical protein